MKNPRIRKTLAGALALLFAGAAQAATYTWSGGSGGSGGAWRQANNWNPSASQSGPGSGDVAVFGNNGSAASIGINFNDGRGLTNPVAAIVLTNGPDRSIGNSAPNSTGTLRLQGWQGVLLANHSTSSVLALRRGSNNVMRVDLASGGTIHVGNTAAGILFAAEVAGTQGFTKTGAGWLRLSHSNSLTGQVTVAAGTLQLASSNGGSLANATALRLGSGSAVELGAARQLGAATAIDLAGGTVRGVPGAEPAEENLGVLTLSADSTIHLAASVFNFADSSAVQWNTTATLTITNWRSATNPMAGRIFFGTGGLTSTQLAQVYFADLGVRGAQLVGPDGELVPIPEAPVVTAALALATFIVWRERRRLARMLKNRHRRRCGALASPASRSRSAGG